MRRRKYKQKTNNKRKMKNEGDEGKKGRKTKKKQRLGRKKGMRKIRQRNKK